ncbi:MAG TPA: T9SS type A sorting domain-containing protein [Flavipsychrobacter sp.]
MKNILFFILLLVSAQVDAQKINFTDPTNEWYVSTRIESPGQPNRFPVKNEKFYYSGDTTINNTVYRQMRNYRADSKANIGAGLIRYDSSTNKVYIYRPSGDLVLYDYNLNVGDTFYSAYSSYYTNIYYTVIKADSTLVNNTYHKRWELQVTDTAFVDVYGELYVVVEGLGCLNAPLDPLYGDRSLIFYNELNRWITCFKNSGNYPSPYTACSDSLVKVLLDVEAPALGQNNLSVYPQPATTYANIQLPEAIKSGTLYLYNQVGQTLRSEAIQGKTMITVDAPATPGLYYYRITNNATGAMWQGKLLFE